MGIDAERVKELIDELYGSLVDNEAAKEAMEEIASHVDGILMAIEEEMEAEDD